MALCQDWKENAIKKAIVIIDEPGHGKQYYDGYCPDDYPEGSPEGLDIETLTKEFHDKNIEMTVFQLNESVQKPLIS